MSKPSRAQRKQAQKHPTPATQVIPQPPMVEICRSFSYTFQARQYEPRNFFCSFKTQVTPDMAEEAARSADDFCQEEVLYSVKEYKRKMAEQAQRGEG